MSATEAVLRSLERDPLWADLCQEVLFLLEDVKFDSRYRERAKRIEAILANPRFPRVEQIYVFDE